MGEKVKTAGTGNLMKIFDQYILFLYLNHEDFNDPIQVHATNLPRNQRKFLLNNCSSKRCDVIVSGTIDTDAIGVYVLVADKIAG